MSQKIKSIETITGMVVNLTDPQPRQIRLRDIAHGLSRAYRFNGHTLGDHPYSVAQHSIWTAVAARKFFNVDTTLALKVLLHDAHETYIGDIATPVKEMVGILAVSTIEDRLQKTILSTFGLSVPTEYEQAVIDQCDRYALAVEAHHLMLSNGKNWPCMEDVPDEIFADFWNPVPHHIAFEKFWMAFQYLACGMPVEELITVEQF